MSSKYVLNKGTQVRREEFGLLFYTMAGPRLYFLPSDQILDESFFLGEYTLKSWISQRDCSNTVSEKKIISLEKALKQLNDKGVIHEL